MFLQTTNSQTTLVLTADIPCSSYPYLQVSKVPNNASTETNIMEGTIDDLSHQVTGHRDARSIANFILGALVVFTIIAAVAALMMLVLICIQTLVLQGHLDDRLPGLAMAMILLLLAVALFIVS